MALTPEAQFTLPQWTEKMHVYACAHLCVYVCWGVFILVPHSGFCDALWVCRLGSFSSIALQIQPMLGNVVVVNSVPPSLGKEECSKRAEQIEGGFGRSCTGKVVDYCHSQLICIPGSPCCREPGSI